jgi:hypothetical protein
MRCSCRYAVVAELRDMADTLDTCADNPDVRSFATPYQAVTWRTAAAMLRARADQIKGPPRATGPRIARNAEDMA